AVAVAEHALQERQECIGMAAQQALQQFALAVLHPSHQVLIPVVGCVHPAPSGCRLLLCAAAAKCGKEKCIGRTHRLAARARVGDDAPGSKEGPLAQVTVEINEKYLQPWIERLKDRDIARRLQAVGILASVAFRAPSAINALDEALQDRAVEVRRLAALA